MSKDDPRPPSSAPTTASMQVYGQPASPDAARGTRAGLVLLYAPSYAQFSPAYLLHERDLIIGREETASLCIPEAAVSRQHARIHYRDGRWVLTDLGGRNGTLIDGEFVQEVVLEHLHEIRIGDAIFKFVDAGAESYARYRIDGTIAGETEGPSGGSASVRSPASRGPRAASPSRIVGGYQIGRLASSVERVSTSEISVIFLGESGTGKEVFAQQLHDWSGRRGAFQAVNCAAIPATLLESELFGYKRGAFSGADRDRPGLVKAAEGGTLFLDEIGDMPLDAQAKLLRVLQSKEIIPVGATTPERVDVRIACATNRDLTALQREGRFRGDLFARLNEYSLRLPPLRERKEDIFQLCRAMLTRHGRADLGLAFPFMTGLLQYDWPFNVRELEGTIKRGIALCEGLVLDAAHLPDAIKDLMKDYGQRGGPRPMSGPGPGPSPLSGSMAGTLPPPPRSGMPTADELRSLLRDHKGNVAAVGRQYGKERMQVHRWMKRYGINVDDYR